MAPPQKKGFHAFVHGRVQGVGFRYSAIHEARRLHLEGIVRNCEDGSVEVVAEGDPQRLDQMLSWLRTGPPGVYVRNVDVQPLPYSGRYSGFDVEF